MPSFSSFSSVTLPTPGKRPTGSGNRNVPTSSGWITKSPSGFRQSEASLARNLFGATPADAVRLSSWRICSRIALATRVAVGKPVLFSVTSRYASSSDSGSTRSVCCLKISRARRETVRYRVKSGGTKTASAHKRDLQARSEEHTSELQSRGHLVCRLLLEKK